MLEFKSKIKDRKMPTVLDIFCGAGGMSLGFQNAGCQILGGLDKNPHAIRTHHKNFPNCKMMCGAKSIESITDLSKLGFYPEDIDILIGGPPCQVFSVVGIGKMKSLGKHIESDARNFLYEEFLRFIKYYKPLVFVIENVNYLQNHWIFSTLIRDLENNSNRKKHDYPGYNLSYQVLTASDYGVPQIRKRLFIVGRRKDTNLTFEFPDANTGSPVSVGEAIGDLPELEPICLPLKRKSTAPKQTDFPKDYKIPPISEYQKLMRTQSCDTVMNHMCRSHNDQDLHIFSIMPQGGIYKNIPDELKRYSDRSFEDKYKRLDWDKPSWTLTAHMQKDCLAYIHPTQTRSISVREAARLQSFPDHFVFDAPMTRMFELVGNSVPPLLAEAIARPIVKQVQAYYEAQSERAQPSFR
ncbi:DNA cytosine methyltransferase [Planktothrix agardhii]|jgi:DNA (cytosine-5)-methyltransferase 1|uniref:DNA (cytosine-5-)-methyltransferase n=1 Tax=Planktothrix agardhii (strain NIVA-CYA 126/8) TaxID=388467 RepID=A0A073CMP1_PLAA1|nr:DNA cytosine methyltransferase [Planktothrix agardhii]KEI69192.1 Dcm [Planktothrix agardhii NIVA-CYA 126/8]CAD5910224.1 Modification methylase XorII [Planktothrix agardhii]